MIRENVTFLDIFMSFAFMLTLAALTAQMAAISSDPGTTFFICLMIIGLSPLFAWFLDKEYLRGLLETKEDTEKFPATLFTVRFYFLFAWVIPCLFVLIVNEFFYALTGEKIFISK